MMLTKYSMYDILLFNNQGDMSVGIVNRIGIIGDGEDNVLYTVYPNDVVIRSEQVSNYLGNAKRLKEMNEDEAWEKQRDKNEQ